MNQIVRNNSKVINKIFIKACEYNCLDIVKELMKDERVDPSDKNNWAIRYASEKGHLDMVKELMKDKRVDPSDRNNWAIRYASDWGHLDVVKELLKDKRVCLTYKKKN
jgi:ankyrin repeat protein